MLNISSQGVKASPSEPQRRQYSSCDPCRSSKRRCFFPSDISIDTSASCAHCTRLGHTCTFNFATSRLNSRPRKRQRQTKSSSDQLPPYNGKSPVEDSLNSLGRSPNSAADSATADAQDDFAAWLNFDIDNYFANDLHSLATTEPEVIDSEALSNSQSDMRFAPFPNGLGTVRHNFPCGTGYVPGSSPCSPVHLLNSKLSSRVLDERLISIFDAILTGSAARFLDCGTNLYATEIRYQIESSSPKSSDEPTSAEMTILPIPGVDLPDSYQHENISPESLSNTSGQIQTRRALGFSREETFEEAHRMTIVGCVRFLDHFGDLYGNRLNQFAKTKSDSAFKAALRVFALQWLPNTGSGLGRWAPLGDLSIAKFQGKQPLRDSSGNLYTDAWYQARLAINEAKSVRSFRAVFATLIFDGIAIPMSARYDSNNSIIDHEFLSLGLQKLDELDQLVRNHCAALGPFSKYAALAESSLTLVRWSGYIRDTGAALTSNHQCRLPDPFCNANSMFKIKPLKLE